MELAVKTDFFRKVVSCVSRATANKAIQPILNNILLSCTNGSLVVSATDLDLAIECRLPAEILKPGKVTLPAKKLDEIVSKASGEQISLSIDIENIANITSDRARFKVNGVSADEFPDLFHNNEDKSITVKQEEILQAISLTIFATSKFESTSILSGVNFEIRGKEIEIGAADGSRLARYIGKIEEVNTGGEFKESIVIPGRALSELEKLLLSFREGNEFVKVTLLPGQVIFQNNDFSLGTRLISGNFPAYDKLIPNEQPNKATFNRAILLSSLERVAVLCNERTSVIKLSLGENSKIAVLDASSPDYGNARDEIDVDYSGSEIVIAFNYRYLTEALRNLHVDKVLLELDTSLSPIVLKIKGEAPSNYTYLIMPVQLR